MFSIMLGLGTYSLYHGKCYEYLLGKCWWNIVGENEACCLVKFLEDGGPFESTTLNTLQRNFSTHTGKIGEKQKMRMKIENFFCCCLEWQKKNNNIDLFAITKALIVKLFLWVFSGSPCYSHPSTYPIHIFRRKHIFVETMEWPFMEVFQKGWR